MNPYKQARDLEAACDQIIEGFGKALAIIGALKETVIDMIEDPIEQDYALATVAETTAPAPQSNSQPAPKPEPEPEHQPQPQPQPESAPAPEPEPEPEPAPAHQLQPESNPAPAPESVAPVYKLEDARAELAKLTRSGRADAARQILANFGAHKLSEVPADRYGDIIQAVKAIA